MMFTHGDTDDVAVGAIDVWMANEEPIEEEPDLFSHLN